MVRRNVVFVCGLAFFFGSLLVMLKQLDRQQGLEIYSQTSNEHINSLNAKFMMLENELKENRLAMEKLRSGLNDLVELSHVSGPKSENRLQVVETILKKDQINGVASPRFPRMEFNFTREGEPACQNLNYFGANCDVEMNDHYTALDWKDTDGGVWKQGFDIQTNEQEWEGRKLNVFVVPHSHNDPGWIKTFEAYFTGQTRHILDNIVDYLSMDAGRRFIWAEISYLSMWYKIADQARKQKMMNLIKNGQLEIVTGGWVMNDEANTHYSAMIDQMIEGHEWLARTFGVIPKSGWAIDPFGHTPTMAYLLKRMGLSNMIIQRVHYSVKRHFAHKKLLEFRWRQQWDSSKTTDINCHLMPFYSYDVPHTCGPDPKVCCQFDFGRLPGLRVSCPWGVPPKPITDTNVEERAKTLLDQYRKKSKLYKTDTLLVILGDDFRYEKAKEAEYQFTNYEALFKYVNSHPELNAHMQFGTLTEYFDAMLKDAGGSSELPSLTGDFFTYADRGDHYWSGYYTSRPFYKTQERNLEANLRGAEILFSLALPVLRNVGNDEEFSKKLYPMLQESRQNLGLFQHHDGITGTSKDPVVVDYGKRLQKSVMNAKEIIARSAEALLLNTPESHKVNEPMKIDFDAILTSHDQTPERVVVVLDKMSNTPSTLVIYNSLSYDRVGIVRMVVTTPHVKVTNHRGQVVPSQTNLIWSEQAQTRSDQFELVFVASVAATGLATYKVSYVFNSPQNVLSKVELINTPEGTNIENTDDFAVNTKPAMTEDFTLESEEIIASFSSTNGLLRGITTKRDNIKMKAAIDFGVYEARPGKERAGAYLFLPNGHAKPHVSDSARPLVRVINGPLVKEVHVLLPNVEHIVTLQLTGDIGATPFGIFITNKVDVRQGMDNKELSMRITSPDVADPDNVFYTDLNGYQMQKRRNNLEMLPLQANFFPMPTMAFIQNEKTRLSVLTGQPRGVASLVPGQLEIVLDRRLMQDDNRGMQQGVKDNLRTCDTFVILVERWKDNPGLPDLVANNHYPSTVANHLLLEILHPVWSMSFKNIGETTVRALYKESFRPLSRSDEPPLPCSWHLVNLRNIESREQDQMPSDESAMILQNFGQECHLDTCFNYKASCFAAETGSSVPLSVLYPVTNVQKTSLSLQYSEDVVDIESAIEIEPMEIRTFKIRLK